MRVLLILLLAGAIVLPLPAQEGYERLSVPAHGAGRTYVVTSRGLDAVGLNPALLMLPAGKKFEFRVFPVTSFGLDAGESFRDVNVLTDLFGGRTAGFSDSARKAVIDVLRDEKLSGRGDLAVLGFAYDAGTFGAFALTWTSHAAVRTVIPQEFLDFFYNAEANLFNAPGEVRDFDIQGMWYNEFTLTMARQFYTSGDSTAFLRSFAAGGALKYASGIGMLKLEKGNYFNWDNTPGNSSSGGAVGIVANYRILSSYSNGFDPKNAPNRFSLDFLTSAEAGSGIGADVGILVGLLNASNGQPPLKIGVSFTDIGSINWKSNAKQRIADSIARVFVTGGGTFQNLSDSLRAFEGALTRIPEFSLPLPTMFRFGAQLDLDALGAKILGFAPKLAFEIAKGLTDVVGSLTKPRFGIGMSMAKEGALADYRLSGGFATDQRSADITLGGGITLFNHIAFDIATARLLELLSSKPRIDLAASLKVLF